MALDAYMSENPPAAPVLRFYSWDPPAVSLGYNQKIDRINKKRFNHCGVDLVRRPTGGRAVYHCKEITYSVVIPKGCSLFTLSVHRLYHTISTALAAGLNKQGIPAEIERNKPKTQHHPNSKRECFESAARFEVTYSGKKMVGSAQRRMADGILQQGSILLNDEQYMLKRLLFDGDNELGDQNGNTSFSCNGIDDRGVEEKNIIDALIWGFEKKLDCQWRSGLDLSEFFAREHVLKERFDLYRAQSHSTLEV